MSSSLSTSMANPTLATPRAEEPADQWASSTLSALHPAPTDHAGTSHPVTNETSDFAPGSASSPATPGVNMPGGFPGLKSGAAAGQPDLEQVKGAALNALETVQTYAASAAATASSAAQNAGETVGQYLPETVKSYFPGSSPDPNRTLPSEETTQNVHPSSTSGAGTLPGPPGEVGVAVLPEERTGGISTDKAVADALNNAPINKTSPISTTTNNNAASSALSTSKPSHTGFIPSSLATDSSTSLGKLPEERRQHTLPSHDEDSSTQLGKSGGVGKLPGSANESGVAIVPDERLGATGGQGKTTQPSITSTDADTDASIKTLPGSRIGGVSSGPGGVGAGAGAAVGGPQTNARQHALAPDEKNAFEKAEGKFLKKDQVDTAVTSRDVGAPHKTASSVATPGHGDTPFNQSSQDKPAASGAGSGGQAGAGGPTSSSPKKHGFMDKMKGEMKVLSGKMSKDESKIEEGRKLMGKN